jgi:hypothetical protein
MRRQPKIKIRSGIPVGRVGGIVPGTNSVCPGNQIIRKISKTTLQIFDLVSPKISKSSFQESSRNVNKLRGCYGLSVPSGISSLRATF